MLLQEMSLDVELYVKELRGDGRAREDLGACEPNDEEKNGKC